MLKSYGVVVVVGGGGGLEQFSVSPRPLGFGFGAKGLGPGLDNFVKKKNYSEDMTFSKLPEAITILSSLAFWMTGCLSRPTRMTPGTVASTRLD